MAPWLSGSGGGGGGQGAIRSTRFYGNVRVALILPAQVEVGLGALSSNGGFPVAITTPRVALRLVLRIVIIAVFGGVPAIVAALFESFQFLGKVGHAVLLRNPQAFIEQRLLQLTFGLTLDLALVVVKVIGVPRAVAGGGPAAGQVGGVCKRADDIEIIFPPINRKVIGYHYVKERASDHSSLYSKKVVTTRDGAIGSNNLSY